MYLLLRVDTLRNKVGGFPIGKRDGSKLEEPESFISRYYSINLLSYSIIFYYSIELLEYTTYGSIRETLFLNIGIQGID